ncbi:MAG TPA: hypothetical protein VGV18_03785 [Verrucomicrobiae bacterium]|nr:hypothetical protein [Verrucomicrobiae bacterium]
MDDIAVMKRRTANFKFSSFALLLSLLFLFGAGCVYAPLWSSRRPISSPARFGFIQLEHSNRQEVEAKLGAPTAYLADLRVSVYPVKKVLRHKLVLFLGFVPIWVFRDYDGYEIGCIQYDGQDRVERWGFITEYLGLQKSALELSVRKWLAKENRNRPGH